MFVFPLCYPEIRVKINQKKGKEMSSVETCGPIPHIPSEPVIITECGKKQEERQLTFIAHERLSYKHIKSFLVKHHHSTIYQRAK